MIPSSLQNWIMPSVIRSIVIHCPLITGLTLQSPAPQRVLEQAQNPTQLLMLRPALVACCHQPVNMLRLQLLSPLTTYKESKIQIYSVYCFIRQRKASNHHVSSWNQQMFCVWSVCVSEWVNESQTAQLFTWSVIFKSNVSVNTSTHEFSDGEESGPFSIC